MHSNLLCVKLIIEIGNKYKNTKHFAVENKIGPFTNLKNAVKTYNFNKNIECSLSDGIEIIPEYINTLIFSGMGGYNVISIIKKTVKNLRNIKKIVFSVHKNMLDLEAFLKNYGFYPTNAAFVEEGGQFYEIVETKYFEEYADIKLDKDGNVIEREINTELYNEFLKADDDFFKKIEILEEKNRKYLKMKFNTFLKVGFINED